MMHTRHVPALAAATLLTLSTVVAAQNAFRPQPFDWPQWQGPERTNRSKETGLLQIWPKDGPRQLWLMKGLGGGYSAPAVAAGRLLGLSYQDDYEVVWARRADNGQVLWTRKITVANRDVDYHEGSRSTPTVDGDRLYALGVSGDLVCLRVNDGAEVWRKNLIKDFGGILPYYREKYGYAESPLVDGDNVLVTPGGTKNTIVALDKKTGRTLWTVAVPEPRLKGSARAAYTSLVRGETDGLVHYTQFLQGGLVGVADGKLLWRWDKPSNDIANCTAPIVEKSLVFASSGYGKGCGLARLSRQSDGLRLEEAYFNKAMKNVHGGIVLVDGHIYGNSDPGQLLCIELKSGKVKWQERAPGKGSILYADGHLYYRDEDGPMFLVQATPEKYVEKGRFMPPERSDVRAWTHPVVANGKLYLRDQDVLICYDVGRR